MRLARAPSGEGGEAPLTSKKASMNTMPNMSLSASPDWSLNSDDGAMMRVVQSAIGQAECRRSKM